MWNRPKDVEQRKDQQFFFVLQKKRVSPKMWNMHHLWNSPEMWNSLEMWSRPKDVKQAQRDENEVRSAILFVAKAKKQVSPKLWNNDNLWNSPRM